MNTAAAALLLLLIAVVLANAPFLTSRFFGIFSKPVKTVWWRLGELVVVSGIFI